VQAVEILTALKKLGEELSTEEQALLANNMSQQMADFEAASTDLAVAGGGILSQVLSLSHTHSRLSFLSLTLSLSFLPLSLALFLCYIRTNS
jgi:hypothetical protein